MAPSPTAEATRLTDRWRTSPAANTPGMLVSSSSGGRRRGQPAGRRRGRAGRGRSGRSRGRRVPPRPASRCGARRRSSRTARPPAPPRSPRSPRRAGLRPSRRGRPARRPPWSGAGRRRCGPARSPGPGSRTCWRPVGPADQHRHPGGVLGQMQGGLAGRVAGPDDEDLLALHGPGLGAGGAVEHPGADQRLQPRHPEPPPRHPGGDDHRLGRDLAPVRERDQAPAPSARSPAARWARTRLAPNSHACSRARGPGRRR